MKKRLISILLCLVMVTTLLPVGAGAAVYETGAFGEMCDGIDPPKFTVNAGLDTFNTLQSINHTGADAVLTIDGSGTVTVESQHSTQAKTQGRIVIEANSTVTLRLKNVWLNSKDNNYPTILVSSGSHLTLELEGNNIFGNTSYLGTAKNGISVANTGSLTIRNIKDKRGSLAIHAGNSGAGIGGISDTRVHGDVTIDSGDVSIYATSFGAGIGGSSINNNYNPNGGKVTINGGTVYIDVGADCAAIGGADGGSGGTVTINNGAVTAVAYDSSYIIGAGNNVSQGNNKSKLNVYGGLLRLGVKSSDTSYDRFYYTGYSNEAYIFSNCIVTKEHWGYDYSSSQYVPTSGIGSTYDDLSIPGSTSTNTIFTAKGRIPEGCTVTIPTGKTLTLRHPAYLRVDGTITGDDRSIIEEEYAVLTGRGTWPNMDLNIEVPTIAPVTPEEMADGRMAYVGVVESSGNSKRIVTGNSLTEVKAAAGSDALLSSFFAGASGFSQTATGWESTSSVVSLVENGALTAVMARGIPKLTVEENNGTVTVTGANFALSSPSNTVFFPKSVGTSFTIEFAKNVDMSSGDKAFTAEFDDWNNDVLVSIPEIFGCSFSMDSVAPLRGTRALRFGGLLKLSTPIADIAGVNVTQLQLNYNGNSATLGGIEASGEVSIPKIGGFVGGGGQAHINTFSREGRFYFTVNLETPVIDGEFEFELKEARGAWLPNAFYLAGNTNQAGIPLVPPTIVAYITGGGLGVYGLADTVAMDMVALPPLRLRMTGNASLVDIINGTVDLTVGPMFYDMEFSDIEIEGVTNIIKSIGSTGYTNRELFEYNDLVYDGVGAHHEQHMEIGLALPWAPESPILSASGSLAFGGFSGISIPDPTSDVAGSLLIRAYSAGSLSGELKIPAWALLVGPWTDYDVGTVSVGYELAGSLVNSISRDATDVQARLEQMWTGTSFNVDGSISADAEMNLPILGDAWARVSYIFGGRPEITGGLMSVGADDSGLFESVGEFTDENGQSGLVLCKLNAKVLADSENNGVRLLSVVGDPQPTGVSITQPESNNHQKYTVTLNSDLDNVRFILTAQGDGAFTDDNANVQKGGASFELVKSMLDTNNTVTNGDSDNYYYVNAGPDDDDPDKSIAYLELTQAGTYTIETAFPVDIQAIELLPYAKLSAGTSVSGSNLSYVIDDFDNESKYALKVYMSETSGGSDYLLYDSTEQGAAAVAASGNITLENVGGLAPTGSYHLNVVLLEETTLDTTNRDGQSVRLTTWAVANQVDLSGYSYTSLIHSAPVAPASASLTYSNNSRMTATWAPVTGADGYLVKVYDATGKYTGVSYTVSKTPATYDTNGNILTYTDAETEITMDLTKGSQYYDETTRTYKDIPGLATGAEYKVGVAAFKNETLFPGTADEKTVRVTGAEAMSLKAELTAGNPPTLTYSDNVEEEQDVRNLVVNKDGGSFTVSANENVTFTCTTDTAGVRIAPTDPQSATSGETKTYTISFDWANLDDSDEDLTTKFTGGAFQLKIKAVDGAGDYAVEYITVSVDDAAPSLTLDDEGKFFGSAADGAVITGQAEAYTLVMAWAQSDLGQTADPVSVTRAGVDGSFELQGLAVSSTAQTFAVEAVDGANNRSVPLKATVSAGSTVSTAEAGFQKGSSDRPAFTLTPAEGATLASLKLGADTLTAGTDYTVSNGVYTLTASKLASLALGSYALTFDMNTGNDPAALLTVTAAPVVPPQYYPGGGDTAPKGDMENFKLTGEYKGYPDVDESKWYGAEREGSIRDATLLGIVEGDKAGFRPGDSIKLCEVIKMAAVVYNTYMGGTYTFDQTEGDHWYDTYVNFAVKNGIIKAGDFKDYGQASERGEMAYIFAHALPSAELSAISELAPPDVKPTDKYAPEIMQLYGAGVLRGNDDAGTFTTQREITRAEAAAIVTRICLPDKR